MTANILDNIFTVDDVAEKTHVKPETVREWLRNGKLKGIKIGKAWLIQESNLKKAVNGEGESESK
jgi:excisionase family DNA binding protein